MRGFRSRLGRKRGVYFFMGVVTILLGLGSRQFPVLLPHWVALYSGDILWALAVFLGIGFLFPRITTGTAALGALAFSFLIEISQLYQTPWINAIRGTKLGGLVLGFGFLWSDLVCYLIGIGVGVTIEGFFR